MPGTPTYSKAVHFDNNLEHVRHFLKVDRPLAVSAGSSPVEQHEGETEFPFQQKDVRTIEPRWQWDIQLPNFPPEYVDRKHLPIRVENVFVSADSKNLIGTAAVHNLAFHKSVVARFTLDYWKTTSEVSAEYSHDIRRKPEDDHDRFNFNIKLEDLNNLEKKTLFFCVRYNVDGQEFWDSNGGVNFQIDFSKKAVPQKGKSGTPGNASRPLNSSSGGRPRPVSVPTFDDFNVFDSHFGSISSTTGSLEAPLKLRSEKPDTIVPDAPGIRSKNQSQAFGTRYDFGASLSATKQGGSFVESPRTLSGPNLFSPNPSAELSNSASNAALSKPSVPLFKAAQPSDKPSLHSQSYNDLINKYCFIGSAKSSPSDTARPENDQLDGTADKAAQQPEGSNSPGSPKFSLNSKSTYASTGEPSGEKKSPNTSPRISRATSPPFGSAFNSRNASPASFGYPYRQPIHNGFFGDSIAPTAIQG